MCLISGAEAARIGRALDSVAGLAKDIIVILNAEVNDGTEEIALRYGARVYREAWKGFVGQKNSAADKATQPWLLNLDADEVVSPELAREIVETISSQASKAAYEFPRCTFYCGRWIRHGDWYPDRVLRLSRRGVARWAGEEPHAHLEVNGEIGRLQSDLLHFSNESIAQQISKIAPYHSDFVSRRATSSQRVGFIEFAIRPFWRFFRAYLLRLGFLDGWQGFYIAALSSFSTLTRYALVREAREKQETP